MQKNYVMVQNQTMNWEDVRLFLALAQSGSARATAAALGISHTTVSRRVEQLEQDLGARLFDRDVRGYRLTAAGETLLSSAVRAEDALLAAERQLHARDAELRGEICLTTSDVIANHLIMPDLVRFTRLYPDIDLNILVSYDVFDLSRREADVALRFMKVGGHPPQDLVGRKLVTAASCYYASDQYLTEHDPWQKDSSARWIGWGDGERYPAWVRSSPLPHLPAYGLLNNAMVQAEAARFGMGLAVLPCFVGDAVAGLRRVPRCEPYANYELWMLSHPDLRDTARLRTFRKFIAGVFEQNKALLTGDKPRHRVADEAVL